GRAAPAVLAGAACTAALAAAGLRGRLALPGGGVPGALVAGRAAREPSGGRAAGVADHAGQRAGGRGRVDRGALAGRGVVVAGREAVVAGLADGIAGRGHADHERVALVGAVRAQHQAGELAGRGVLVGVGTGRLERAVGLAVIGQLDLAAGGARGGGILAATGGGAEDEEAEGDGGGEGG